MNALCGNVSRLINSVLRVVFSGARSKITFLIDAPHAIGEPGDSAYSHSTRSTTGSGGLAA